MAVTGADVFEFGITAGSAPAVSFVLCGETLGAGSAAVCGETRDRETRNLLLFAVRQRAQRQKRMRQLV